MFKLAQHSYTRHAVSILVVAYSAYLIVIGSATLLTPKSVAAAIERGNDLSCYPWIRLIGPMAIPFGVALVVCFLRKNDPTSLAYGFITLSVSQIPLDLYLILSGAFRAVHLAVDLLFLTAGTLAVVLFKLNGGPFNIGKSCDMPYPCATPRHVKVAVYGLSAYLVMGWFWAVFLPRSMNEYLGHPIALSCIPWVQLTGPLALAMAVALVVALSDPARHAIPLFIVGIGGCLVEIGLDLFMIYRRELYFEQVALDLIVAGGCLLSLAWFLVSKQKRGWGGL